MALTRSLSAGCLLLISEHHPATHSTCESLSEKSFSLSGAPLSAALGGARTEAVQARPTSFDEVGLHLCSTRPMPFCHSFTKASKAAADEHMESSAQAQQRQHAAARSAALDDSPTESPVSTAGGSHDSGLEAAVGRGPPLRSVFADGPGGGLWPTLEEGEWRGNRSRPLHPGGDSATPVSPHLLSPSPSFTSVTSFVSQASSESSEHGEGEESTVVVNPHKVALQEGPAGAATELFFRLNHARQTVDYAKRQLSQFSQLDKGQMDVWTALELLNELREYESALLADEGLDPDMPLKDHALQTAEACRLAYPEHDWLHLVGLLHGLGKLLAHKRLGGLPQWTICGESFPVGCSFSKKIACPQFFSVNPDRRRRIYNSSTGMYRRHCGLKSVYMSWSAAEYLHLVLVLNRCTLPPAALFVLRHQKFASLLRGAYRDLLSEDDRSHAVWLERFTPLATYRWAELPGRLQGKELHDYYDALIRKYIPEGVLYW